MSATTDRRRRAGFLLRAASLGLVAASVGLAVFDGGPPAQAAGPEDSSITIEWGSGAAQVGPGAAASPDEVKAAQPDHAALLSDGAGNDNGLGHWDDFRNLKVAVDKTAGLGDEVISVEVSGLAASTERNGALLSNFVQAMQCWGPDPNAADFYETCQFGSWKMSIGDQNHKVTRGQRPIPSEVNDYTPHPFKAVTGQKSKPAETGGGRFKTDGLENFFTASSSNELPMIPVRSDGTARFGFETQSAASQPYLGCGDPESAAGNRCWLVIVPRGVHSGEWPAAQSTGYNCYDMQVFAAGAVTSHQVGSPVSPDCSYFSNRVVVPLDFDDTRPSCPPGSAERRVTGSEAVSAAFASWQSGLCVQDGVAYSLNTNSGNLTRSQLLTGQSDFAVVARALAPDTIGTADPALLQSADIRYAPLANTALALGFIVSDLTTQIDDIKLTPRLIAKLLTQSYRSDIPSTGGRTESESWDSRTVINMSRDPEWLALGNPALPSMVIGFIFVSPGPQGDDAINQLWQYVQSDADAAAFLGGDPDPWGMTVNPYYLPTGHPNAAGGGFPSDLSEDPIETFPRADQSLYDEHFDAFAWNPYAGSFHDTAVRVFRADSKRTYSQEPNTTPPKLIAYPPELLTRPRTFMGPMTASDASDYRLATASLAVPLEETTTEESVASARSFVPLSTESMAAAVAAQAVDAETGVARVDFEALPDDAYPLTFTANAAVDLASTGLDRAARDDYAALLQFVADAGQVPGAAPGQLPAGYVPLTEAQRAAARDLADALRAVPSETPEEPPAQAPAGSPAAAPPSGAGSPSTDPSTGLMTPSAAATSTTEEAEVVATQAVASPAQGAVGAALAAGLIGLLGAPFLLRRPRPGG